MESPVPILCLHIPLQLLLYHISHFPFCWTGTQSSCSPHTVGWQGVAGCALKGTSMKCSSPLFLLTGLWYLRRGQTGKARAGALHIIAKCLLKEPNGAASPSLIRAVGQKEEEKLQQQRLDRISTDYSVLLGSVKGKPIPTHRFFRWAFLTASTVFSRKEILYK